MCHSLQLTFRVGKVFRVQGQYYYKYCFDFENAKFVIKKLKYPQKLPDTVIGSLPVCKKKLILKMHVLCNNNYEKEEFITIIKIEGAVNICIYTEIGVSRKP